MVLDITVHNADTLAHLLGEYPKTVTARTQNAGMGQGLEDGCMGVMEFPSGLQAYTHEAFTTPSRGPAWKFTAMPAACMPITS